MGNIENDIAGFVALPVILKPKSTLIEPAKHYIYIKPHDPQVADEDAPRSLFLVNIPISTTESHLRYLFTTQLDAGRIETVRFAEDAHSRPKINASQFAKAGRKRKRMTANEIEVGLENNHLPRVFDVDLQISGATAVVVFIDRPGMDLSLKAAKHAVKRGSDLVWAHGKDQASTGLGIERYEAYKSSQFPSRKELLKSVDKYMTAYAQMEEVRSLENAKKRQMPDDDGFITVTKGTKRSMRKEEAQKAGVNKEKKSAEIQDFYRFQMRERRKEQQSEMLRKFEEDKRTVKEMKQRRGKIRPE